MQRNNESSGLNLTDVRQVHSPQLEAMPLVMEQLRRLNSQLEAIRFGKVTRDYPQFAAKA